MYFLFWWSLRHVALTIDLFKVTVDPSAFGQMTNNSHIYARKGVVLRNIQYRIMIRKNAWKLSNFSDD